MGLPAILLLVVSTVVSAQWVMVGRKVVGRITSVTQPRTASAPGCDAATVILDAEAGKVFSTAVGLLQKNPNIAITRKDDAKLTVAFRQGDWASEVKVTSLGDHLSQMLIVSSAGPGDASGTSAVLDAVRRVCGQLGVKYSLDSP
jgi:hypothetical protein